MVQFAILFDRPADVAAFDAYYDEVHTPLVHRHPGLERLEVVRPSHVAGSGYRPFDAEVVAAPGGESQAHAVRIQDPRDGGADPAAGARHERHFAFEGDHSSSRCRRAG